jgi:Zn-dependent protease
MIVIPGRIPIAIHPFFWIMAALIGWMYSGSLFGMLIWIGIVLVSVIIHEFGHALTAVAFGQEARIQLIALGGLTSFEGPKLKFWQQFVITFNGPLFGFFLFLIASALLKLDLSAWPILHGALKATQIANLFWTIVNLLPVLPLDGGQLLRIVLEASFGVKGFKAALLIGAIISILLSFYFFIVQAFLIGALFFLFAFQSFDSWRKSRIVVMSDREEENRQLLTQGEIALQAGKKEAAKQFFEKVREKTKGGVLSATASQYLAILFVKDGKHKEAYDLLLPIEEHLADDTRCLLHQLAAEFRNYPVVAKLSSECYQVAPTQEMALRNARAFAYLKQPKLAGGWLQTAWAYGGIELAPILSEEEFIPLAGNLEFKEFVEKIK